MAPASSPGARFSNPLTHLDSPANLTSPGASFLVRGWTLDFGGSVTDGDGIETVHVWAFATGGGTPIFVGDDSSFDNRPDLAAAYGARFANSEFRVDARRVPLGRYTLVAYARSRISGAFARGDAIDITVSAAPAMSLDAPGAGVVSTTFTARGWAVDLGAGVEGPGVDGVHIYAFPSGGGAPQFLGASYGVSRADVGAVFGSTYTSSGFDVTVSSLAVGSYQLVAYAHSTVTGTFNISAAADITVQAPVSNPRMSLDGPTAGQQVSQPFVTGGWAIDLGAATSTGVDAIHVWAFPVNSDGSIGAGRFVDQATLNGGRPDVAAVYGSQFQNAGFNFLMTGLAPGTYIIGVNVHSGFSGAFDASNAGQTTFVRITVQ